MSPLLLPSKISAQAHGLAWLILCQSAQTWLDFSLWNKEIWLPLNGIFAGGIYA